MTTIKNEVKVETVKNNIDVLNSKKLKAFLQSAMNTRTTLENYVPKITAELVAVINEYNKNQKDKVVLKDQEKFDIYICELSHHLLLNNHLRLQTMKILLKI